MEYLGIFQTISKGMIYPKYNVAYKLLPLIANIL